MIAIIGYGWVGKAYHKVFPDALIYDHKIEKGIKSEVNLKTQEIIDYSTKEKINECELAIVCVPTPMLESDQEFLDVDISVVVETINWLETPLILIKSTIPPGTTDELIRQTGKRIAFSPEYTGEGKYQITPWKYMSPDDPRLHEFQIFGGDVGTCEAIANIFIKRLGPEKTYYICSAKEGEVIKYMENSWGAMKVIFANEFYQLCKALGISYHRVREGWALDNRVEKMHTAVFVDNQGFAGKCYPKDLNGIVATADKLGVDMSLIKAVLRKNKEIKNADSSNL